MRLWGKVVSAAFLIIAAVLFVVGAMVPEAQLAGFAGAAIAAAFAFFAVPLIVRLFMSITGDEQLLESGTPGLATITMLRPTGWRYNRVYPVVRFGLSVEFSGIAYPVETKQTVAPDVLKRLAPGAVVGVRVDPTDNNRVVIDWSQPIKGV